MKKTGVLSILIAVALVAVGVIAEAQQPKKVPRIGYLSSGDPATESVRAEPIRAALRDLGYIEGQNITIEYRYTEGKGDRAPDLAGGAADQVRVHHQSQNGKADRLDNPAGGARAGDEADQVRRGGVTSIE